MKFDKLKFDNHKYINVQKHLKLDLCLYNYSPECQFENKWDEYTIIARGLVLEGNGNVISFPMKKFWNYSETLETSFENLPKEIPNVTIKEDGSLIGVSWYQGQKVIHTRGSFESDQAKWATKWLENKNWIWNDFNKEHTFWFEAIYPENKIVIDYHGYSGLKMITIFNKIIGEELSYKKMVQYAMKNNFDFVCERKINCIEDLLKIVKNLNSNEEGFVCRFSNNLRIKLKGKEYVDLHKVITGMNNKTIWEHLSQNKDLKLNNIPDELYDWIETTKNELKNNFQNIYNLALEGYKRVENFPTRKEQASFILKEYKDVSSSIFQLLDNKDPSEIIWKTIKPKYQKAFLNVNSLNK